MVVSPKKRAALAAALARGDVPSNDKSDVMYVGEPKIRLTNLDGNLIARGESKCVMENGHRVERLKVHHGPNGPE